MVDITDQIVDFYNALFLAVFFEPFSPRITDRRRRDAVQREILDASAAASQSLERFFASQQLTALQVECILHGLEFIGGNLKLEEIANPYIVPENIVERLLTLPDCCLALKPVTEANQEAVYRVALYSVVQGLMQVGPVMAEWRNIGFPSTFELTRRAVARLNEISAQLDVLGSAGSEAADDRYELQYRDYLAQRFYRVEAGTVRMTTNLSVDLRELFIMPNVLDMAPKGEDLAGITVDAAELMPLSQAREVLAHAFGRSAQVGKKEQSGVPALQQVRRRPRNVLVGAPGSGKSTFLEWFQMGIPLTHQTPTCRLGLWRIIREPSRSLRSDFRPRRAAEHTW